MMHRHNHTAYHSKYEIILTKITINGRDISSKRVYKPTRKPKFYKTKGRERFRVYFQTKDEDTGKAKAVYVNKWKGRPINTPEMAQAICDKLWEQALKDREPSGIVGID
jgi:hypothetical protein